MSTIKTLIIITLASLVFVSASLSGQEGDKPSVAIIDFFPFGYTNNEGKPVGMFFDIADKISREMGVDFDLKLLPVPRALRDVSSGEVDMLISYKDPLMVPKVEFLGKVGCLTSMLVSSSQYSLANLNDLNGHKVGYITGGYFDKRFSKNLNITGIEVPSNEAMLNMLIRGRLDAIVINDAVFNAYRSGLNQQIELPQGWLAKVGRGFSVETMETHLSMSDNSKFHYLKPRLRQVIKTTFDSGGFQNVYKRYKSGKKIECQELATQ